VKDGALLGHLQLDHLPRLHHDLCRALLGNPDQTLPVNLEPMLDKTLFLSLA
jgi:hypothetical protein